MRDDQYFVSVSKALLSYQMVGEALKLCIGVSYEVIAASNPPEVSFKFSPASINDAPLGNLVKMFAKVSNNQALIKELQAKKLGKWRNFFAHNAFAHEFMSRNSQSSYTPHSVEEVQQVSLYVGELVLKLGEELKALQKVHARLQSDHRQI
ncbi:hypothetical protein [Vreelandella alkaliphila]|uniref:hypothetical protein n=1 Tax=Vreelandella alkaliphila TaxID=272774 RepID=UPI003F9A3646